mmetsp:Transcript_69025/g.218317  ORF Transcript_69025/g.218317 Transcript_69025/m.218317 type:complete len:84 (+) Transcript_69025:259-510(+)
MSAINVTAVNVLDNPTGFSNPFQFEIQYECVSDLKEGRLPPGTCAPRPPRPGGRGSCGVCARAVVLRCAGMEGGVLYYDPTVP